MVQYEKISRKRSLSWEVDGGHSGRNKKGTRYSKGLLVICGTNVVSTQMMEVSPLGVKTVLRLETGAWALIK